MSNTTQRNMKIIIHPGYERTATSTLQDSLFGKHPGILSIGRPWNETTLNFVKELRRNDLFYNKDLVTSYFDKLGINKNINKHHKQTINKTKKTITTIPVLIKVER